MEQDYVIEGLQKLEGREEGENANVEAYSDLGNLHISEQFGEIDLTWETDADFREVLETVESLYRRTSRLEGLKKDIDTGRLTHENIRDYVLEGPVGEGAENSEWSDYHLLEFGGSDFRVSWDRKAEDRSYRIRVSAQGSGSKPFRELYLNTVDGEGLEEDVVEEVENEFFDHPRSFPGFFDPSKNYE